MKWLRLGLQIVGALALIGLGVAAWFIHDGVYEKVNAAKRNDAIFVLNWGGISTNQDFHVIGSYRSPRNFNGDHLDIFCIQLEKFEVTSQTKGEWRDGPEKDPVLAAALEFGINDAREHVDCFPPMAEANSQNMKIMFWSVVLHGRQPTGADILLYDPKKSRLYFVSSQV
jgi:hypothetical protein